MRITESAKLETQQRIVTAARKLFVEKGFDATTTRDLAAEAGIATGTLFNYFPAKEALALELMLEAAAAARLEVAGRDAASGGLAEKLFLLVATEIRHLRPCRGFVKAVLETSLSPFASGEAESPGGRYRREHLQLLERMLREHGAEVAVATSFIALHLYWTLYIGVLAFWAEDDSPNQEETLVALDQATRLFVDWLGSAGSQPSHLPGVVKE
ncbi:MAG: TetR family transcriptional regulator [Phycisphaerales bacterium JB038]